MVAMGCSLLRRINVRCCDRMGCARDGIGECERGKIPCPTEGHGLPRDIEVDKDVAWADVKHS